MSGLDLDTKEILDRFVPAPADGSGDWDAVLADATVRRRRLGWPLARVAFAASAAVAAALVLALAWPFGGSGGLLDRALAAAGGGPVLHVVLETHPDGSVVDLSSGRRERPEVVFEQWFEPGSELRQRVIRANGAADAPVGIVTQRPTVIRSGQGEVLAGFILGYRDALRRGDARVFDHGTVSGRKVTWIRFDRAPGETYQVAVDDETGKPVYLRFSAAGMPDNQYTARVVELESVGDMPKAEPIPAFGVDREDLSAPDKARGVMTRPSLWLGASFKDLPLAHLTLLDFSQPAGAEDAKPTERWKGIDLVYGGLNGAPAPDHAFVEIEEQTHESLRAAAPPEGSILVRGEYGGELQKNGVYMLITASSEELVLEAARSLQQIP
jgi:hypothetical protein